MAGTAVFDGHPVVTVVNSSVVVVENSAGERSAPNVVNGFGASFGIVERRQCEIASLFTRLGSLGAIRAKSTFVGVDQVAATARAQIRFVLFGKRLVLVDLAAHLQILS